MTLKHYALIGSLFVLSAAPRLLATVKFVQVNYKTSNSASSLAIPYLSAQTAGNLNIVVVGWNDSTSVVNSVTDSKGNSYLRAVGPTVGTKLTQSIYYAKNIAAGSNTLSVTFNTAVLYPDVRVLEYSGADKTNPLDVTAAAAGTSLNSTSGPASTTSWDELIFGAGTTFNSYLSGSEFSQRVLTNFGDIAEDAAVTTMGTYGFSASLHLSAPWVTQMATFRAQTASSPAFTVSGLSPASGTTSGGTSVKISGTNFLSGATVTFGGIAGTNVTVPNGNTISVTTPSHAAGTVNVVVTNALAQSATLTNAYTYTSAPPAGGGTGPIRFVQVKSATPHPTSSSVAITYSAAQTAGNLNVVEVGWNDTTSAVSSVTDSRGNSYVLAIGPTRGTGLSQSIYYAKNIVSGSNTVTVAFNKAAAVVDVRALEYSGLDTVNPLDVTSAAAGTGTTGNGGAVVINSANELIVGAGMTTGAFTKAGPGFTSRIITSPDADIAEDLVTTAGTSYSATAPISSSAHWVMQMAVFHAGAQATPQPKHSVSISWDPSSSSSKAYYKVYRGTVSGGPYSLIGTNITADTYKDSTVQSGVTYYYVTSTVSTAGLESIFSNQFKCTIPTP